MTFSQAEGLAEVPGALTPEEMPYAFRVQVWSMIYNSIQQSLHLWRIIASILWVKFFNRPLDEFDPQFIQIVRLFKPAVMERPYNEVFDFLTVLLRHEQCPRELPEFVGRCLRHNQMAYYLDTSGSPTFVPQSSPEEGAALRDAIGIVKASGMDGARAHLLKAAEAINQKKFPDSVRESIHAVESVAKVIGGEKCKTLRDAIEELKKQGLLTHEALSAGFRKLYGYTSDETGIRHSLLEGADANVDVEEAVFMLGACASFCGYLCRKRAKMSSSPDGD